MAEDQNIEVAKDVQSEHKKKSKLLVILLGTAVLIVAVLVMFLVANTVVSMRAGKADELRQETWAPSTEGKVAPLDTFPISTLQINLADPTGSTPAIVRATLALAYRDNSRKSGGESEKGKVVSLLGDELQKRNFEIRDKIISIISSKSYEDLNSTDKQLLLKKEIINQVNGILIYGGIQDVYISDFNLVKTSY